MHRRSYMRGPPLQSAAGATSQASVAWHEKTPDSRRKESTPWLRGPAGGTVLEARRLAGCARGGSATKAAGFFISRRLGHSLVVGRPQPLG